MNLHSEFPECHRTPCLKQSQHLKIQKLQRDSNPQSLNKQTLNHLAKLASLGKWLSVRLRIKWLCVRVPLLSLIRKILVKQNHLSYSDKHFVALKIVKSASHYMKLQLTRWNLWGWYDIFCLQFFSLPALIGQIFEVNSKFMRIFSLVWVPANWFV